MVAGVDPTADFGPWIKMCAVWKSDRGKVISTFAVEPGGMDVVVSLIVTCAGAAWWSCNPPSERWAIPSVPPT